MKFLTTPRTWEELPGVAQQLARCRCASGPFAAQRWTKEFVVMHDTFNPVSKTEAPSDLSNLLEVTNALANIVSPQIDETEKSRGKIYKVERNRLRDKKRGRSPMFPFTPEDVLPFGARISMNSLFNWYQWCSHHTQAGAPSIAGLISQILMTLGDFVVPAVLSSQTLLDTIHYVLPWRSERLKSAKPEDYDFHDLDAACSILVSLALIMPPLLLAKWILLNNNAIHILNMETAVLIVAYGNANPIVTSSGETIHLAQTMFHFTHFHKRLTVGMRRDADLMPILPLLYQHNELGAWTQCCDEGIDVTSPYAEAPWKLLSYVLYERCFAPGCIRSFYSERR
jgi:hypothetical protein